MNARSLMTPNPRVVTGSDTTRHAARLMREKDVGIIPVVDDLAHLHLRGVITDRDVAVRCVAEQSHGECVVEAHMTAPPIASISPEADVAEVIRLMEREQVRRVMVTEGGRLVGVIAQADIALRDGPLQPLRVEAALERISSPHAQPSIARRGP